MMPSSAALPAPRVELSERRFIKGKKYIMRVIVPISLNIPSPQVFMAGLNPLALPHDGTATATPESKLVCAKCGPLFKVETNGSTTNRESGMHIYNFLIKSVCSSSAKHLNTQVFLAINLPTFGLVFFNKPILLMAKESRKPDSYSLSSSSGGSFVSNNTTTTTTTSNSGSAMGTPAAPTAVSAMELELPQAMLPAAVTSSSAGPEPVAIVKSLSTGNIRSCLSAPSSLNPSPVSDNSAFLPDGGCPAMESPLATKCTNGNLTSSEPGAALEAMHLDSPVCPTVIRTFHFACSSSTVTPDAVRDMLVGFYAHEFPVGAIKSHVVHLPQNDSVFITTCVYRSIAEAEASHTVFWKWVSYMDSLHFKVLPLGCYCSWY